MLWPHQRQAARLFGASLCLAALTGCNAILGYDEGAPASVTTQAGGQAGSGGQGGGTGGSGGTAGAAGSAGAAGAPRVVWSYGFGSTEAERGWGVAAQPDGTVVLTGSMGGPVDFGGGPLQHRGELDIYLAKLAPDGGFRLSNSYGSSCCDESGLATAFDAGGNILLFTENWGTVDFGGGPLVPSGGSDVALAKLGSDGTHLWSQTFPGTATQAARALAVDDADDVIVGGFFYGTTDFGFGARTSFGDHDAFVAGFTGAGQPKFDLQIGGTGPDAIEGVATDSAGHILVAGRFSSTVVIGTHQLAAAGETDIFVAKLSPDNADPIWAQQFGGALVDTAMGVATDSKDNVVVCGYFADEADFGGGVLQSAGSHDAFVVKLDPDGNHLWSRRYGDEMHQSARAVAVDALDRVAVVGLAYGSIDFGLGSTATAGGSDAFVALLDPDGEPVYAAVFGYTLGDLADGVAADAAGGIVVTGLFSQAIELGHTLVSQGDTDIFVARLEP